MAEAATAPAAPALELEAVGHRFGDRDALRDVGASIHYGRITGLVGPDGAGKTTLLRLCAGLLAPSAGRVRVEGLDPIRQGDELRRMLGYMPQKFGLYEDLSVRENLELYADLRAVAPQERAALFARLLEFTDLGRFTDRLAGRLSGGMKQKLGLACTLLGAPRVLLLDEPSVGVDPISRRELWAMVGELAGSGMAVVWSTSYLDEAERCTDLLLMHAGRVEYAGSPAALVARMRGRSLQLRGMAAGSHRAILRRALRQPEVMDGVVQGAALRLVLRERGRLPQLAALDAGPTAQLVEVAPRLEDAFIDILGGGPGGESPLAAHMPQARLPAQADESAVIAARGLTRRFGDFTATDNVDFRVRRGEIFGLLGPNGAGKSTTFKMMCGLLEPSAGSATVMGLDLKLSAGRARRELGYMAQKFALYGDLTVEQNLRFFSGIYGLAGAHQRETVAGMVAVFALQPYLAVPANDLPLGFKQRLALACALMHQPPLLFLDEPTSGVDPITRREFWTHINGLVDKGVTVMVTTHFMDEAEYCDRIGLVYRGRLIATGTPDDLKASARSGAQEEVSMEEAFIRLVRRDDAARESAA